MMRKIHVRGVEGQWGTAPTDNKGEDNVQSQEGGDGGGEARD